MNRPEVFVEYMAATDLDEYLAMPVFAYSRALENITAMVNDETLAEKAIGLNELIAIIKADIEKSAFGLALRIEDIYQYQLLAKHPDIKALIAKDRLQVKMANEYHVPLNAVVFSERDDLTLKPYKKVMTLSPSAATEKSGTACVIVKELLDSYRDKGKRFCVDKANMASMFGWLKKASENQRKFSDMDTLIAALAKGTGLSTEKAVSGFAVLEALELIDFKKSDTIIVKIIEHKEKKELEDAAVYAALLRL
jgi:hypothetical protein